jgi:hypothetical protein
MRLIPAIIIAIAVLLAPLLWLAGRALLPDPGGFGGGAVDSGARIEIEMLRQQIEAMQERLVALEEAVARIPDSGSPSVQADPDQPLFDDGNNAIIDAYAQVVLIANRRSINKGLTVATPDFLEELLGRPREVLTDACEEMTNPRLADMLMLEAVGPIQVRMLQPAIDSLVRVFARVEATDPDLYARISTAGSLCVRRIRGTVDSLSSHAFGLSLDLNIDGRLDTLGDDRTQLGLTILADFFRTEGWIWGAGFGREDSMHFEVSREMLEQWRRDGRI